jgi:hypothetical protein
MIPITVCHEIADDQTSFAVAPFSKRTSGYIGIVGENVLAWFRPVSRVITAARMTIRRASRVGIELRTSPLT